MQNHVLEPCVLELLTTCFGILKRKYIKKKYQNYAKSCP